MSARSDLLRTALVGVLLFGTATYVQQTEVSAQDCEWDVRECHFWGDGCEGCQANNHPEGSCSQQCWDCGGGDVGCM